MVKPFKNMNLQERVGWAKYVLKESQDITIHRSWFIEIIDQLGERLRELEEDNAELSAELHYARYIDD